MVLLITIQFADPICPAWKISQPYWKYPKNPDLNGWPTGLNYRNILISSKIIKQIQKWVYCMRKMFNLVQEKKTMWKPLIGELLNFPHGYFQEGYFQNLQLIRLTIYITQSKQHSSAGRSEKTYTDCNIACILVMYDILYYCNSFNLVKIDLLYIWKSFCDFCETSKTFLYLPQVLTFVIGIYIYNFTTRK